MPGLFLKIWIISLHFIPGSDLVNTLDFDTDTSLINKQTRKAFSVSRTNPDSAILIARGALAESITSGYDAGIAGAYLALGSAWLAKYFNKDDSARFFNTEALIRFRAAGDLRGIARASYNLAYVQSIKGNLRESEKYGNMSLENFSKAGDKRGIINSYSVLSYISQRLKDFSKATGFIEKAVLTARESGDTIALANVLNSRGNIFKDMALFGKAIDSYFEALSLWESRNDSSGIAIAYGSIGLMYYYQKDWNKALEYSFRKVPISREKNDLFELSKTYNTIAQIYSSKRSDDTALIYFRKAMKLNIRMNYISGIASSYNNMASTFLANNQIDSAEIFIEQAIETAGKTGETEVIQYFLTKGTILQTKGQNNKALASLIKAYELGKKYKMPVIIENASMLISRIYSSTGRKDLAYDFLKEYHTINDSISNDAFHRQITRMELQNDFDKKQKEAEYQIIEERIINQNRLKHQKLMTSGLISCFIIVLLVLLLVIRYTRLRAKFTRIDLEQRLLRTQMNPHFISNALCAVQELVMNGKPDKANYFIVRISRLMRNILENSREEFIPLEKEIESVRSYLELQQLRFEGGFDYEITVDEKIDAGSVMIPPMLAQPCVENSVEHGFHNLKKKGMIRISYLLEDNLISLEISDNGAGLNTSPIEAPDKKHKKSLSTLITLQRLNNFRKTMKEKGIRYEISDITKDGCKSGTKVLMTLPYKMMFS